MTQINVGGLVAAGFDETGQFLLTVTHSGRGIFSVANWERIARDPELAYPNNGYAMGIGPLDGMSIPVTEVAYEAGSLHLSSPDGSFTLDYYDGVIKITPLNVSSNI